MRTVGNTKAGRNTSRGQKWHIGRPEVNRYGSRFQFLLFPKDNQTTTQANIEALYREVVLPM